MLDMHTHHQRCGHATGQLEDFVKAAIKQNLTYFGLSDHAPLFAHKANHPMPRIQMAKSEFPAYLDEATELKQRYSKQIRIQLGVEADFLRGTEKAYDEVLREAPLDYVLGSVHWFEGSHVFMPETWKSTTSADELYRSYFAAVQDAARSGLFDVLSHMDALKAMGPQRPPNYKSLLDETIDVIAESGIAVELNTSGLRKCGEIFPERYVVEQLHARGVKLTYGSDCHQPHEVAYGWQEVYDLLRDIGVRHLVVFEKRQPILIDFPAVEVSG